MTTAREQEPRRGLTVREAAWLARVNDDTVRDWVSSGILQLSSERTIAWDQLDTACRNRPRRPHPALPVEALDLTPEDVARLSAGIGATVPPLAVPPPDRPVQLTNATRQLEAYRRTIRELLDGSVHQKSATAAAERAMRLLLDRDEADGQLSDWTDETLPD